MSGLFAVCGSDAIHIVTDGAITGLDDGRIVGIAAKQSILRTGVVAAGTGVLGSLRCFASRAEERCKNFDELAEVAPELWKEALVTVRPELKAVVCNLLYAGWSEKAQCLSMDAIDGTGAHGIDQPAFAVGPNENCRDFLRAFVKRFVDDPDAFDPIRDGLEFMETLRRDCLHKYERATHPAVGGFVQHTEVTREAITTKIVRHWPDLGGRPIDIDATHDPRAVDEGWYGRTLGELRTMRENLVNQVLPLRAASAHVALRSHEPELKALGVEYVAADAGADTFTVRMALGRQFNAAQLRLAELLGPVDIVERSGSPQLAPEAAEVR